MTRWIVLYAFVLCTIVVPGIEVRADERPAAEAGPSVEALVKNLKSREYADRLAAAEAALGNQDRKLTAPLVKALGDERLEVRSAAIRALGARTAAAEKKSAAKGLGARLPRLARKTEHQAELLLALQSLHDLAQPTSLAALLDDIAVDTPEDVVRARLVAVANVPDPKAIDELIQFVARGGRKAMGRQRRIAVQALGYATGERMGQDPDAWRAWWKENRKTFDFGAAAERRAEEGEKRARKDENRKKKRKRKGGGDGDGDGEQSG